MNFLDGFGFTTNLISIITIIISVYIFFTDLFRRWLFFGYKPTAIVIVMDSVKNDMTKIISVNNKYYCNFKYIQQV